MAYQHLFGSASGGATGAGYKTLAVTDEFYNVMSDDELSNVNNYTFAAGDEHPVKFCHYYREYKQCFVQSTISFEYDYVGRNSSIAHTLVLTEAESRKLLNEHVFPFNPAMFLNAANENFVRPTGDKLPAVDYVFPNCRGYDYNTSVLGKFFKIEVFAEFVLAILLSAENGYSVYIKLPGTPREASFNALRIMDIITPAFPAEYKTKLGFMTYATDTNAYQDIMVYFVSGIDLSRQFVNSAYCFDLSGGKANVSGLEASTVREYSDLIRAIMSNILSYDNPSLNDYYNAIMPKTDVNDRFYLQKINEIYFMWKFLSDANKEDVDSETACSILESFYDFCGIVDNKAAFINRINGYWEHEIEKCKAGGYTPGIDVFNVIDRHFPEFDEEERRQAQRIWSFVVIYTMADGNSGIFDKIFSFEYVNSALATSIFEYISHIYIGFVYRKDTNAKMAAAYENIIGGCIRTACEANTHTILFEILGRLIKETDIYFEEMGIDKGGQYALFSSVILAKFEDGVASRFSDAGLQRKFTVLADLRKAVNAENSTLGSNVYDHFRMGCFMPGVVAGFSDESIRRIADDRKAVTDLADALENFPELENIEMIAVFRHFSEIINRRPTVSTLFELNELVNKPEKQNMVAEWIGIYNKKEPDLMFSLLANTRCRIGSGGSIQYHTNYRDAYSSYYEATGQDAEQMMRELNRFIGEAETAISRPENKDSGLASFREPTAEFINEKFFDKSVNKKAVKENEARLKHYDRIAKLLVTAAADAKEQKKQKKLFGKK